MPTLSPARAHARVALAIKLGELAPIAHETKCVDCGEPAKEYDHRDYSEPLVVEAVCKLCFERHNLFFDIEQWKELLKLAKKTGLSVAEIIRRAVDDYLKGLKG